MVRKKDLVIGLFIFYYKYNYNGIPASVQLVFALVKQYLIHRHKRISFPLQLIDDLKRRQN